MQRRQSLQYAHTIVIVIMHLHATARCHLLAENHSQPSETTGVIRHYRAAGIT
jgi:hypothetical protein